MPALPDTVIKHRHQQESFFSRYAARWPGTLLDPYDLLGVTVLERQQAKEIAEAAAALWQVYQRVLLLLQRASDQALLAIGIPSDGIHLARTKDPDMANPVLGRFDFAITPEGCKMLEFNVDAPGLMVEAFSINGIVCREAGRTDPNAGGEASLRSGLAEAIRAGYAGVDGGSQKKIAAVVAGKQYTRDYDAARYIWNLVRHQEGIRCGLESVQSLEMDEQGIFDAQGRRIDVLVRIYGIMYLGCRALRRRGRGTEYMNADDLHHLVESKMVKVINPPSSYLLDSKAVQVLIWALYEDNAFFSLCERDIIERYMLPSYLDRPPGMRCVVKPAFGSNGDAIVVDGEYGSKKSIIAAPPGYVDVFQKYVELPSRPFVTENGEKVLKMVISCFVLGGRPIGLVLRAGEGVTDVSWWVVPICF